MAPTNQYGRGRLRGGGIRQRRFCVAPKGRNWPTRRFLRGQGGKDGSIYYKKFLIQPLNLEPRPLPFVAEGFRGIRHGDGPRDNGRSEIALRIVQLYGKASAPQAKGHVVVIDVLRAFSTAAYAFAGGIKEILIVAESREAFDLKKRWPDLLLAGESGGRKVSGFDFGNSPAEMQKADLKGRRLVLRSSAGTQGVVNAKQADRIFLGSLNVARATINRLLALEADPITLLAMGSSRGPENDEDIACAEYLASLAAGSELDVDQILKRVRNSPAGKAATREETDWISTQDLDCATAVNAFGFSMAVERQKGLLVAKKIEPGPQA